MRKIAEGAVDGACFIGIVLSFEINRQLLLKALNLIVPKRDFLKGGETDTEDDEIEFEDDEIEFEDAPPPYSEVVNDSVSGN